VKGELKGIDAQLPPPRGGQYCSGSFFVVVANAIYPSARFLL
jgi:hypothetical protein